MLNTLKFMSLIMIFGLGLSLSACETMEGAGQDIEHAGEAVQDAANQSSQPDQAHGSLIKGGKMSNRGLLIIILILVFGALSVFLVHEQNGVTPVNKAGNNIPEIRDDIARNDSDPSG